MANVTGLSSPVAVELHGVLYLVGIRNGEYRIRRSADGGETWLPYIDGLVEKTVAGATSSQRAGLTKLRGQGSALVVCVPRWPHLITYKSLDDGETWLADSEV